MRRALLALLGGGAVAMALPPWGFWPLAFVGIAVFEVALGAAPTRRQAAGRGLAFGLAWMAIGMCWMLFLTPPGYVFSAVLFASFHAVAATIAPGGRWRLIGRPAAHTLVEAIRLGFPFGGVPLATLGISQAGGPLLGVARVGGVIAIGWIVCQIGFLAGAAAAAAANRDVEFGGGRRLAVAAVAAVVVVVGVAALAPAGRDIGRITIAGVQGGGEQGTSALDVPSSLVTQRLLDATADIAPSSELDLVVWPENGIDVDLEPFDGSAAHQAVAAEAARLGVPISVGVTEDSEFATHPAPDSFVNAQVVVTPEGDVTSRYEKARTVPFGEYVPLRGLLEALGAPLDQIPRDAIAGRDPALIELPDGTRLGVMISWEVFFGGRGRAAAEASSVLLNPTNGASYTGTILQTQQVASSKLRAVETGRWLVQVAPTGFSAFVDPDGGVHQRTGVSEREVITMAIATRTGTTWYMRLGNWPWALAALAALLVAVTRTATTMPPAAPPSGGAITHARRVTGGRATAR